MKATVRYFLAVLLFFGSSSYSFIYKVNVLRTFDAAKKRYKYFFGFSDFHNKSHPANNFQINAIAKLLKKCPKNSAHVIIEDISSSGFGGRTGCGLFFVNSKGGVLSDVTQKCRDDNLAALSNLEYRYCRVTSMGPVLNNLKSDLHKFTSVAGIKVQALIDEIESVLTELASYNDGKILSNLYKKYSKIIHAGMKEFNLYNYADLSVADFLQKETTSQSRLAFIKKILTFDSILLDLKMLHEIENSSSNHYNIVTLAGGAHIKSVSSFLKKLGYEEVFESQANFIEEKNLTKCIGGTIIDGSYCLKPNALDLLQIESFL